VDNNEEPTDSASDAEPETREEREARERERSFRRLGDSLISSIWGDSSAAFKRGQGLVTGVAHGTKEELVRMISAEVRGFLDKMDAADLVQEIVSGLVIEMKTEIRFRRDDSGRIEPDVRTTETRVESEAPADPPAPESRRRQMGQVVKDFKDKAKADKAKADKAKADKAASSAKPAQPSKSDKPGEPEPG